MSEFKTEKLCSVHRPVSFINLILKLLIKLRYIKDYLNALFLIDNFLRQIFSPFQTTLTELEMKKNMNEILNTELRGEKFESKPPYD